MVAGAKAVVVPAMGYNTWNDLRCEGLTARRVLEIAEKLDAMGLRERGYEYFNVDDCWATALGEEGELVADPVAFPDGMLNVSRSLRMRGFKFGLYADRGYLTCAGRPGSRGRERLHAAQFAEWEVDYLKYDSCYSPNVRREGAIRDYRRMREALRATGRDVLFAVCGWSAWYAPLALGDQWRISADADEWANVYVAIRTNEDLADFAGARSARKGGGGGFNDPDMLVGSGAKGAVRLTPRQSRTQFALWAVMAAPLLLGASDLSDWDLETYSNTDVIAVDRDHLAIQGTPVRSTCPAITVRDNWWCSPWSMPQDVVHVWRAALARLAITALAVAAVSLVVGGAFREERQRPNKKKKNTRRRPPRGPPRPPRGLLRPRPPRLPADSRSLRSNLVKAPLPRGRRPPTGRGPLRQLQRIHRHRPRLRPRLPRGHLPAAAAAGKGKKKPNNE